MLQIRLSQFLIFKSKENNKVNVSIKFVISHTILVGEIHGKDEFVASPLHPLSNDNNNDHDSNADLKYKNNNNEIHVTYCTDSSS